MSKITSQNQHKGQNLEDGMKVNGVTFAIQFFAIFFKFFFFCFNFTLLDAAIIVWRALQTCSSDKSMGAVGGKQETHKLDNFSRKKRVLGVMEGTGEGNKGTKSKRKRWGGKYVKLSVTGKSRRQYTNS